MKHSTLRWLGALALGPVVVLAVLLFAGPGTARAALLPIVNPSFESPAYPVNGGGAADGWVSFPNPAFAGIATSPPRTPTFPTVLKRPMSA